MKIPSENDILVYSMSAQVAPAYDKPNTKRDIDEMAIMWDGFLRGKSRDFLINQAINDAREDVEKMNWALDDIEGVTWFLGKYVRIILKAGLIDDTFLGVMTECMRKYFNRLK